MISGNTTQNVAVVVPHAGTWIEIQWAAEYGFKWEVVPHAGTWIEITNPGGGTAGKEVVPHAGTWIEICMQDIKTSIQTGRSPRGNVD